MRQSLTEHPVTAPSVRGREKDVTAAFVSLVTAMADRLEPVDLLAGLTQDCVRLLDVASAGLLLADAQGELHLLAASSDATRTLELYELQRQEGPCLDCYRTGQRVSEVDLTSAWLRWPSFIDAASEAGLVSVHAFPMRLGDRVLGALGLFGTRAGTLNSADADLAQALAHVAAVALITDQVAADAAMVNAQLQTAFNTRVVLEQAKGIIAEHGSLDVELAFAVLRRFARDRNYRLAQVAGVIVRREVSPKVLLDHYAQLPVRQQHRQMRRPGPTPAL